MGDAGAGESEGGTYEARFDLGHGFRLFDRRDTFHVSQAGIALGNYLVHNLRDGEISGRILEIGTGSGAIALLLRSMGATSIAATDISGSAVATARQNELANFGDALVDFRIGDLFADGEPRQRYDLIVFNPPGWRAPSDLLKAELLGRASPLGLEAMFYGDSVLLRFLQQLPEHLADGGRAVIGLNSLIGIADVFDCLRSTQKPRGGRALRSQLLERVEFPLHFYTDEWREVSDFLLAQFERERREYAATYISRGETIHWFYEITEVTVQALTAGVQMVSQSHERSLLP